MKRLCIIPARGGSKRIPGKNIRPFLGKPIIAYSIETAIGTKLFERIIVSTEDDEIAEIAMNWGAEVPFRRSPETADDYTGIADVLMEVLDRLGETGSSYDVICTILPTAPLLSSERIRDAISILEQGSTFDAVFPVGRYESPIQRALQIRDDGEIVMVWPEHRLSRSQDLPSRYFDAGQFYVIRTDALRRNLSLFPPRSTAVVLPGLFVQDIDTESDWHAAEQKYRAIYDERKRTED